MKLIICMNGSNLSVEVSEAVYLALDENRRKAENLYHEKRRIGMRAPSMKASCY